MCSIYHVREPETQRLQMSLPDFVQCSRQWRARRLYLRVRLYHAPRCSDTCPFSCTQSPPACSRLAARKSTAEGAAAVPDAQLCSHHMPQTSVMQYRQQQAQPGQQQPEQQRSGAKPALAEGSQCARGLAPYLLAGGDAGTDAGGDAGTGGAGGAGAAGQSIDWEWLEGLQSAQRFGPVLRVELEAGSAGGLLPAAYECADRLVAQVAGRRRVLLLPPGQAFDGLYPYPTHHPYDRYSMVDFEAPDAGLWPEFGGGVRGLAAVLAPGDVLYVPAFW